MVRIKNKTGFTLIEILLYTSIAAFIVLSVAIFLSLLFESRVKQQVESEVEQQGTQALQIVLQTARNAEAIIVPPLGGAGQELRLDVITVALDPTRFYIDAGKIQMMEGTNPPTALTNDRVEVTSFTVRNLSRSGTPGNFRVEMTIRHKNPEGRQEYKYEKSFYASASIRDN